MKNSFLIPVVFFANLVIWVCSLSVFSVLGCWRYLDAVSSGNFELFFVMCSWRALYMIPAGLILALPVTFFFMMRHRTVPFISIPVVLAIVAVSVAVLVPMSYRAESSLVERFPDAIRTWGIESPVMSDAGYIRVDPAFPGKSWVDLAVSSASARRLLVADATGSDDILSFTGEPLYDRDTRSLVAASGKSIVTAGGTDPLFAPSLACPAFLRPLFADGARVIDALRTAYDASFFRYLTLAGSFFVSLTSLWCLCRSSGWRMLNVFLVLSSARALFALWPLADGGRVSRVASRLLPSSVPGALILPAAYVTVAVLVLAVSGIVFLRRKIRHIDAGSFYE
jgi:hypothetical protein